MSLSSTLSLSLPFPFLLLPFFLISPSVPLFHPLFLSPHLPFSLSPCLSLFPFPSLSLFVSPSSLFSRYFFPLSLSLSSLSLLLFFLPSLPSLVSPSVPFSLPALPFPSLSLLVSSSLPSSLPLSPSFYSETFPCISLYCLCFITLHHTPLLLNLVFYSSSSRLVSSPSLFLPVSF